MWENSQKQGAVNENPTELTTSSPPWALGALSYVLSPVWVARLQAWLQLQGVRGMKMELVMGNGEKHKIPDLCTGQLVMSPFIIQVNIMIYRPHSHRKISKQFKN